MDGKSKLKSHLQHTMLKTLVSVFGFKEFFQTHIKLLKFKVPQNWDWFVGSSKLERIFYIRRP